MLLSSFSYKSLRHWHLRSLLSSKFSIIYFNSCVLFLPFFCKWSDFWHTLNKNLNSDIGAYACSHDPAWEPEILRSISEVRWKSMALYLGFSADERCNVGLKSIELYMLSPIMSRRNNLGRFNTVTNDVIFKPFTMIINMVPSEMYVCKLYVWEVDLICWFEHF